MGKSKPLGKILVDAHGVTPKRDLAFDPFAVQLAGRWRSHRLLSRWAGWGILLRGPGRFGGFFRVIPGGHPGGFDCCWMRRIVLRSTPSTRSISRWDLPASSKVWTEIRKFGFKTFTPRAPFP